MKLYYSLYAGMLIQCLILMGIVLVRITKYRARMREHRLFTLVVVMFSIMSVCEFVWTLIEGEAISIEVGYFINSLYFASLSSMGYLWLMYVHRIMKTKISQQGWMRFAAALPMLVFMVASVSSYWTKWIFYIDDDFIYHRGSLYVIQTIVGYGYILWSAIGCTIRAVQKENFVHRRKYLILASMIIFPAIFGVVQIVIPGLPTLAMGFTISIINVYMGLQQDMITLDPLTKMNNYTGLLNFLSEKLLSFREDEDFCMVTLTLHDLRTINKTFSIDETDDILIRVSNALRTMGQGERYFLCRYAGSKFAIICWDRYAIDTDLIRLSLEKEIDKALAEKPYHIAYHIGIAHYHKDITSISKFIHMAEG